MTLHGPDQWRAAIEEWATRSCGAGSQGERFYAGSGVQLPYARAPGTSHWLLVRRSLSDPAEHAYFRVCGPAETALEEMVRVAGLRWAIAERFEDAKGRVGLDQYEVRTWQA